MMTCGTWDRCDLLRLLGSIQAAFSLDTSTAGPLSGANVGRMRALGEASASLTPLAETSWMATSRRVGNVTGSLDGCEGCSYRSRSVTLTPCSTGDSPFFRLAGVRDNSQPTPSSGSPRRAPSAPIPRSQHARMDHAGPAYRWRRERKRGVPGTRSFGPEGLSRLGEGLVGYRSPRASSPPELWDGCKP